MPLAQTTATVLLCLLAAAIIVGSLISIARDADWVIIRGAVRGQIDRFRRRVKPRRD